MPAIFSRARIAAAAALVSAIFIGCTQPAQSSPQSEAKGSRTFRFTYAFAVRNVQPGQPLRVWFPAASSNSSQTVRIVSIRGDLPLRRTLETEYGNAIYFAETLKASQRSYHFRVVYEVERREHVVLSGGELVHRGDPSDRQRMARFMQPDKLVPVSGKPAELADMATQGKHTGLARARAIYDYVFAHMRYDKSGRGWGRGDTLWACDAKYGNCTDFHSLFISMARAKKIPARFEIGFSIPSGEDSGQIAGYHCWTEFYLNSTGWVPIDISEAWKHPQLKDYYFGAHDPDRIQFSIGRDIRLQPAQAGPPLNYFVYPYVEVDGKEFSNIALDFHFDDLNTPEMHTADVQRR